MGSAARRCVRGAGGRAGEKTKGYIETVVEAEIERRTGVDGDREGVGQDLVVVVVVEVITP